MDGGGTSAAAVVGVSVPSGTVSTASGSTGFQVPVGKARTEGVEAFGGGGEERWEERISGADLAYAEPARSASEGAAERGATDPGGDSSVVVDPEGIGTGIDGEPATGESRTSYNCLLENILVDLVALGLFRILTGQAQTENFDDSCTHTRCSLSQRHDFWRQ